MVNSFWHLSVNFVAILECGSVGEVLISVMIAIKDK
jgi:hypothetical protein